MALVIQLELLNLPYAEEDYLLNQLIILLLQIVLIIKPANLQFNKSFILLISIRLELLELRNIVTDF